MSVKVDLCGGGVVSAKGNEERGRGSGPVGDVAGIDCVVYGARLVEREVRVGALEVEAERAVEV